MEKELFVCPLCHKKIAKVSMGLPTVVVCYCKGTCQEVGELVAGRFCPSIKNVKEENKTLKFPYTVMHIRDEIVLKRIGLGMVNSCAKDPMSFLSQGTVHFFIHETLKLDNQKEIMSFINNPHSTLWKRVYLMLISNDKKILDFIGYRNFSVPEHDKKKIIEYMKHLSFLS